MSEHTPGPLTIHLSKELRWDKAGDYGIADQAGKIIGEAYKTVGYGEENQRPAEANARLWAAAPDLVDAAESVVGMLYGVLCQEYGHPDAWPADRAGVQGYRELRAAIAKARGRQP